MKLILESTKNPAIWRVRIWTDQQPRVTVDREIGASVARRIMEAGQSILQTYGGFDRYGR